MPKVFSQAVAHLVFTTKERNPWLSVPMQKQLEQYITAVSVRLNCPVLAIGGYRDHIHVLIIQSPSTSISSWIRTVKACSTTWVKTNYPLLQKFSWQQGYGHFSVSYDARAKVIQYIRRQERHHRNVSSHEEWLSFLKRSGVDEKMFGEY